MARPKLKAVARKDTGTASARRIRKTEVVPAIVYGLKKPPYAVAVNMADIMNLGHGLAIENLMLDLKLGSGEKSTSEAVLVKEVQHDPLTGKLLHIDFNAVSLHEKIALEVPLEETGEPAGVTQQGGILEHLMRTIRVECLPADIPEEIMVDVSSLMIGDSLYVRDVAAPPGVTILEDAGLPVFSVAAPRVEEEAAAAPEEEEEAAAAVGEEAAAEEAEEKPGEEAEKKKE
jgi:large subunit ribosomal protein L25